jgi:Glycosyltransferase family 87
VEYGPVTRHASPRSGISVPPVSSAPPVAPKAPGEQASRGEALRAYWLAPQGLVMLAVTGLALAIRLYLLSRLRYLTGITEYDDGVYLGGAVSLLSGAVPYRDFAFVQPPGILLLMMPAALVAKASSITAAMGAARLLTVAASAVCVALTGALVRHRGPLVTLVACGVLAVYPDDIITAHTLLLEPWMNLLALSGACCAFRRGRLAPPPRLLWAGVLFGLAGAVKYWALVPALGLLAVCLLAGGRGRAAKFAFGTAAGFAVPVLPFALAGPAAFIRSTLLDQASRAGSAVPLPLRLAHLTGLADLLNDAGKFTVSGSDGTLFARGDVTAAATWATSWLPAVAAAALALLLAAGFAAARPGAAPRRVNAAPRLDAAHPLGAPLPPAGAGVDPLGWYALGTLGAVLAAVLSYSAFFYHYADFAAPWLAVTAGYATRSRASRSRGRSWASRNQAGRNQGAAAAPAVPRPGRPAAGRRALALTGAAVALAAGFQAWELSGQHASDIRAAAALIPPGACVVTDEISLAIAASRFTAGSAGCPDVLDALAVTLVADNGVSVQGGAQSLPQAVTAWQAVFARAPYVWLSGTNGRRIPWTPGLRAWFGQRFRPLNPPRGQFSEGQVYVRRG